MTVVDCFRVRHSIELDSKMQWAIIRYRGVVAIEDSLALLRQLVATPGWTPHCDRIVVYDEGLLGNVSAADFRRIRNELDSFIRQHYGTVPNHSAQVCGNPMQRPLVEYWVSFGARTYGPKLQLFETVEDAQSWLLSQRGTVDS